MTSVRLPVQALYVDMMFDLVSLRASKMQPGSTWSAERYSAFYDEFRKNIFVVVENDISGRVVHVYMLFTSVYDVNDVTEPVPLTWGNLQDLVELS